MATRKISYREAINEALEQEMERDSTVILMGEDVAGGDEQVQRGPTRPARPTPSATAASAATASSAATSWPSSCEPPAGAAAKRDTPANAVPAPANISGIPASAWVRSRLQTATNAPTPTRAAAAKNTEARPTLTCRAP